MLKIFLIIAGVIIFAGGGYFFWQQQKPPAESPKTISVSGSVRSSDYINTKYNFSVVIPNGWKVREFPDTKDGAGLKAPDSENEDIVIAVRQMAPTEDLTYLPFREYVKVAASKEIQNHNSLATIEEIVTRSGIVGFKTTWNVQSMMNLQTGEGGKPGISLPITYFPLPEKYGNYTLQISLGSDKYLDVYKDLLISLKYKD